MRVINDSHGSLAGRAPFIISIQICVFMERPSFGPPGRLPHEYEIRENYRIMYEALGAIKYVFVLYSPLKLDQAVFYHLKSLLSTCGTIGAIHSR